MRLTVLKDDPGECIEPGRERITIYLNSVEVKEVFYADDDVGEVKRQTLFGQVRIERCPR